MHQTLSEHELSYDEGAGKPHLEQTTDEMCSYVDMAIVLPLLGKILHVVKGTAADFSGCRRGDQANIPLSAPRSCDLSRGTWGSGLSLLICKVGSLALPSNGCCGAQ